VYCRVVVFLLSELVCVLPEAYSPPSCAQVQQYQWLFTFSLTFPMLCVFFFFATVDIVYRDLNNPNQYVVGLALCALGNIASSEIARDVTPDVIKLFESSNPHIRKKATLCAVRIMRKVPETMSRFVDKIKTLIVDRHHGVLLTATTLMVEILETGKRKPRKYLRPVCSPSSSYGPSHTVCSVYLRRTRVLCPSLCLPRVLAY
jgi:vesicle coat complex subunit